MNKAFQCLIENVRKTDITLQTFIITKDKNIYFLMKNNDLSAKIFLKSTDKKHKKYIEILEEIDISFLIFTYYISTRIDVEGSLL